MRFDDVLELKQHAKDELAAQIRQAGVTVATSAGSTTLVKTRPRPRTAARVSLALGVALGDGEDDYKLAVRLSKQSALSQSLLRQLKRESGGELDVRFVGRVSAGTPVAKSRRGPATARATALAHPTYRQRRRPLGNGFSIAHVDVTAGTIGGFVRSKLGYACVLSNNHVLADTNRGSPWDEVWQPAPSDRGNEGDHVAWLESFVRLLPAGGNRADAAIAALRDEIHYEPGSVGPLTLRGIRSAPLTRSTRLFKAGRTTGETWGYVQTLSLDQLEVDYDGELFSFDGQLEIVGENGAFSEGGDSGSLIVDDAGFAVGQLFAGSELGGPNNTGLTYASPIDTVLQVLDVELLTRRA